LFFFGGGVSVRRVLLFPKGNNVDHLSIYLDVADSPTLPYGWSRFAHFSLAVVNQYDPKITVKKGAPLLMHLCFVSKRESLVLL
jgi:ubiquitin carboxyl-terminal hydrolase 7